MHTFWFEKLLKMSTENGTRWAGSCKDGAWLAGGVS
jgi:hypothetical protein